MGIRCTQHKLWRPVSTPLKCKIIVSLDSVPARLVLAGARSGVVFAHQGRFGRQWDQPAQQGCPLRRHGSKGHAQESERGLMPLTQAAAQDDMPLGPRRRATDSNRRCKGSQRRNTARPSPRVTADITQHDGIGHRCHGHRGVGDKVLGDERKHPERNADSGQHQR